MDQDSTSLASWKELLVTSLGDLQELIVPGLLDWQDLMLTRSVGWQEFLVTGVSFLLVASVVCWVYWLLWVPLNRVRTVSRYH